MRTQILATLMIFASSCGEIAELTDPPLDSDADADADSDADSDTDSDADSESALDPAVEVCARWLEVRDGLTAGGWSGSVSSCDPGDVSADARASTLDLWNLYREMVGHGPVTSDPDLDSRAQACALIQHANGRLSHNPSSSSPCYPAEGAASAGASNLSPTGVVPAIDLYMADPGNATTLGHRRWLLANQLSTVGIGGTDRYSCHTVIGGGRSGTTRTWTAWPPPGPVPAGVWTASWAHLDSTGWSLQSDTIRLGDATVRFSNDLGETLPVTVTTLLPRYGSQHAISMVPDGWTVQAGRDYTVDITGIEPPISYTVEVVDCDSL